MIEFGLVASLLTPFIAAAFIVFVLWLWRDDDDE